MISVVVIAFFSFIVTFPTNKALIIGECQAPNEWKTWLNVHRPTDYGEFEIVSHYQQIFAGQSFVCSKPSGLEVKTVDNIDPEKTGDTFRFTMREGFLCLNQIIFPKKPPCKDYKIRFCCAT